MVQTGTVLVVPGNQQRHAKGARHDALLAVGALAEAQGQITNSLRAALDPQLLVVVERVALALHARVLNHGPRVGLQARHGAPDVPVDLDNLLDGRGFEQSRGHALLDAQDHALAGGNADGGRAELDGLEGVLDLEEAAFGGEGAVGRVLVLFGWEQMGGRMRSRGDQMCRSIRMVEGDFQDLAQRDAWGCGVVECIIRTMSLT